MSLVAGTAIGTTASAECCDGVIIADPALPIDEAG